MAALMEERAKGALEALGWHLETRSGMRLKVEDNGGVGTPTCDEAVMYDALYDLAHSESRPVAGDELREKIADIISANVSGPNIARGEADQALHRADQITAADRILFLLATHSPAPTEAGLKDGEWFYPEGDHSSDECRFSVDEVIDYALEGESVSQIVYVERATSLPAVYAAVRVWTDAEKDERESDDDYDYTLFATAEEARAHLAQQESTHDQ